MGHDVSRATGSNMRGNSGIQVIVSTVFSKVTVVTVEIRDQ